jgi:hypothetical protein
MWSTPDVIGLLSKNGARSDENVVLGELLFSINLAPKRNAAL